MSASDVVHTIVLILHIMGAGLIISTALFSSYVLSRKVIGKGMADLHQMIGKKINILVGVQVLTGLYLFFSERSDFQSSKLFWIKMIVFVMYGVLIGGTMAHVAKTATRKPDGSLELAKSYGTLGYFPIVFVTTIITLAVFMVESMSK